MTKYALVLLLCLSGCGENKTQPGEKGLSAYEIALANGFVGSEQDWLDSLVGRTGSSGTDGASGRDGIDGANGTNGVDGIDGTNGVDGKDGIDGTNGTDGRDGRDGTDGEQGPPGQDASGFMLVQPIGTGPFYIFNKGSLYGLGSAGINDSDIVPIIVKLTQSNGYFSVPSKSHNQGFFGYSTDEQLVAFYGGKKWITRFEDDQVSVDSLNVEISTNYNPSTDYNRCGNGFRPTVVIKNTSETPLNELHIYLHTGHETRSAEIYIPYKGRVDYNTYRTYSSFLVVPDSPVLPGETFSFSYACGGVSVYAF